MKKTILVFGGAGFIGSFFVKLALKLGFDVVIYDAFTYAADTERFGETHVDIYEGDISDVARLNEVFDIVKPDYIVNFAAETHVDNSIHGNTRKFIDSNIVGVYNILELLKTQSRNIRFVQISTDEVYGSLKSNDKQSNVDSLLNPSSVYSSSKASADMLCNAYYKTWGVQVIVTRSTNNYGEWQHPEKLIPFSVLRLLEGKKLTIYGTGANIRDWLYVEDNVEAIMKCMTDGIVGEVYLIGGSNEHNNLDIAKKIINDFYCSDEKWEEHVELITDRPGHDMRYAVNNAKTMSLGWVPKIGANKFDEKLNEVVTFYRNNRVWLEHKKAESEINSHIK